jgi:hypothetical protein
VIEFGRSADAAVEAQLALMTITSQYCIAHSTMLCSTSVGPFLI